AGRADRGVDRLLRLHLRVVGRRDGATVVDAVRSRRVRLRGHEAADAAAHGERRGNGHEHSDHEHSDQGLVHRWDHHAILARWGSYRCWMMAESDGPDATI